MGVNNDLHTDYVTDQVDISRRHVQQLAGEYRDNGDPATIKIPGRMPFVKSFDISVKQVLEVYEFNG